MGKRTKIRYPGAILLVWVFLASIIAIGIYVRIGGTGQSNVGGHIIAGLIAMLIYPVVKYLKHDLAAEQEAIVLERLDRFINQGKYDKAKRYLERKQFHIRDENRLSELKERLGQESGAS